MISSKTKLFAIIGDPVERSLSPAMHNAAFRALGLDCRYIAIQVPKGTLADVVKAIRKLRITGFNVTHPHKVEIVRLLDGLDESAKLVGAVNTVKTERGKLIGYNTDGAGAVLALKRGVSKLAGRRAVLLGAGGAARAIAFSLVKAGAKLTLANRTAAKARGLAAEIKRKLGVGVAVVSIKKRALTDAIKQADLLVNATTIGMAPDVNETLVTAGMMHRRLVVNDIVYEPLETKLLREAKRAGARTVNGLGMLVNQGALALEIWTGKRAPVKVMEVAAKRELQRRSMG